MALSKEMAAFVTAAIEAAGQTEGLVDATLLDEIEQAGYRADHLRATVSLPLMLALAPARRPGGPHRAARWQQLRVDGLAPSLHRPAGVKLDGGGIVRGLCADEVGRRLAGHASFLVDSEGDLCVGGTAGAERAIGVFSPFNGQLLHEFGLRSGGLATSNIAKRSWYAPGMRPAHHILDPATGTPAYTGIVQATAVAPTALRAETLAKAALLSGPEGAERWLRYGGMVVFDDGSHRVISTLVPLAEAECMGDRPDLSGT